MSEIRLVINAMKDFFGDDKKRINHALSVLNYSREIMNHEKVENNEVVESAAVLHDIGIHEAERKYNSAAGHYQEIEGPPIARNILEKLEFDEKKIKEICDIIAHHHTPGKIKSKNFQILYEADWLENLQDDFLNHNIEQKKRLIQKNFKTETGKKIAYGII